MSIDTAYVRRVSHRLLLFSDQGRNRFNFRCPYCGDSKKNQYEARGNLKPSPRDPTRLIYKCFNCGIGPLSFRKFLRDLDQSTYSEYLMDSLRSSAGSWHEPEETVPYVPEVKKKNKSDVKPEDVFERVIDLESDHPAVLYLESRKIPRTAWHRLYYTAIFKETARFFDEELFKEFKRDEGRLVLPLIVDGKMIGFQGRSLDPDAKVRYYLINIDRQALRIFGADSLNTEETVMVVEGPIDSLFIDNCCAICSVVNYTKLPFRDVTFFMDQEPRNPEVVRITKKMLEAGERVVMLPEDYHYRDINELVMSGMDPRDIKKLAISHSYQGARGLLKHATWKKI